MAFKPFGISHLGIHPDGNTERNYNKRRLISRRRLLIRSLPTGNREEPYDFYLMDVKLVGFYN